MAYQSRDFLGRCAVKHLIYGLVETMAPGIPVTRALRARTQEAMRGPFGDIPDFA